MKDKKLMTTKDKWKYFWYKVKTNIFDYANNGMIKLFFNYALGYLYVVDELEMSNSFYYNLLI